MPRPKADATIYPQAKTIGDLIKAAQLQSQANSQSKGNTHVSNNTSKN